MVEVPFSCQAGKSLAAYGNIFQMGDAIQKKETRVVAGPLILGAGIAQPRYDIGVHDLIIKCFLWLGIRLQQQLLLLCQGC